MNIPKCDICKKKIDKAKGRFYISRTMAFDGYDICGDCGKPLQEFLKKHNLGKE
ncbi:MAG TPA: hypothetical protein VHQ41_03585 [Patescibacteria group bacterium]|jgi:ribosomal protein L34E|nr:hypothetical protein [Patescibacteria group bacterium]